MKLQQCPVLNNQQIAPGHFVMRLKSKSIASRAKPGQFIQISLRENYDAAGIEATGFDPLLPRPFSFMDQSATTLDILYQVVGKGTGIMAQKKKGDTLQVLGPLGNGWKVKKNTKENIILVGGGVGIPPLFHLAKSLTHSKMTQNKNIKVILGGRNKTLLHCEKDFKKLGLKVSVSTDDGSKGIKGLVTELLEALFKKNDNRTPSYVYTCGPTPMLKAVTSLGMQYNAPCQVSVEEPMACGFGACIGCAIELKDGKNTRFAMSCMEGPVFDGAKIVWKTT